MYLEEYEKVLTPLALTLDFLQGQNNTYFGYLLPSILSLKNQLHKLKSKKFKYGGELMLNAVIAGLEHRFSNLLQLQSKDAVTAAVLCPNFKLRWYNCLKDQPDIISIESIKKLVITAGNELNEKLFEKINSTVIRMSLNNHTPVPSSQ